MTEGFRPEEESVKDDLGFMPQNQAESVEAAAGDTIREIPANTEDRIPVFPDSFAVRAVSDIPAETDGGPRSGSVSPYLEANSPQEKKERKDPDGEPVGDTAGFWPRITAALIDAIISAIIWLVVTLLTRLLITDRLEEPFFFNVKLITVLYFISYKAYYILSEWRSQRTLGKRALRIKLISSETLGKPDRWTVFFRETFGKFISGICVVGDLMLLGKEHRPLYDRLSDTEVVYTVNLPSRSAQNGPEPSAVEASAPEDTVMNNN
ncbi:MAG: RDD family protein [Oscillospiraceae bacterium]|nr:RDD family protein [Oscillospiraceae bacterium]